MATISYRLAPELKFSVRRKDCFDAVKPIAAHAADFGTDLLLGFVMGGHSWGGFRSRHYLSEQQRHRT